MKKFLLMTLLAGSAMLGAGENLVTFGCFSENDIAKWTLNSRQRPFKPYAIKDGVLVGQSVDKIPGKEFIALSRAIPALEAKGVYEFGCKVKLSAVPAKGKFFRMAIREANEKGRTIRYCNIEPMLNAKGEWLELFGIMTVNPKAKFHQIYLIISNFAPGEKVEIDDVFVRKCENVAPKDGNLVRNGDFESGLAAWTYVTDPTARSTAIAIDAQRGKVLRVSGDTANRRNRFKTVYQELPVLEKGKVYTFSFAFKANMVPGKNKCARIAVREIRDKVRTVRYIGNPITASSDWKTFERKFSPAPNASGAMLMIACESMGDDDVIMVDDIKLIRN